MTSRRVRVSGSHGLRRLLTSLAALKDKYPEAMNDTEAGREEIAMFRRKWIYYLSVSPEPAVRYAS